MSTPRPRLHAIDGLRGLAVAAVVVEHAAPDLLPGGFAGVDLFFVLSGFLITGQILRDRSAGTFSFAEFYARRVRRILPASLLTLLITALAATLLLGPALRPTIAEDLAAAAASLINLRYAEAGLDYFAAPPTASPVLHYWSIAVEEQFYLVYPLLLLLILRLARSARVAAGLMGALALASFIAMMTVEIDPAFYLLPFRAWELIAGGIVALGFERGLLRPGVARRPLMIGGLAAIAAAFVFAPLAGPWPNPAILLPVAGGVALIIAGSGPAGGGRLLEAAPLRALGYLSFSLYLLHWPLIAIASLLAPGASWAIALAVAGALLLAACSTHLFEEPIRRSRRLGARTTVAVGLAGMVLTAAATVAGPPRLSAAMETTPFDAAVRTARSDRERTIADRCITASTAPGDLLRDCHYGAAADAEGGPTTGPSDHPVVVLFGDSHANVWFPVAETWAAERGLDLVPLIRNACSPFSVGDVPLGPRGKPEAKDAGCLTWLPLAMERIRTLRPTIVIVASNSTRVLLEGVATAPRSGDSRWQTPAEARLHELAAVAPVLWIGEPPVVPFDPVDCFGVHRADPTVCARPLDTPLQPEQFARAQRAVAAAAGVVFLDPTPALCPDGRCTWLVNERPAYLDPDHLTSSGAALVRAPLEAAIDATAFPAAPIADLIAAARDARPRTIDDGCLSTTTSSAELPPLCRYGAAAAADGSPRIGDVTPGEPRPTVVLFGDTSANIYLPWLDRWARERGLDLVPVVRSACSPFSRGAATATMEPHDAACLVWLPGALDRIETLDPVLLITASNSSRVVVDGTIANPRTGDEAWIAAAIERLRGLATRPLLYLGEPPRAPRDPLVCLNLHRLDPSTCAVPVAELGGTAYRTAAAAVAAGAGARFIDPTARLCPDGRCDWIEGERVLYADATRLSLGGVEVIGPALLEALEELLPR